MASEAWGWAGGADPTKHVGLPQLGHSKLFLLGRNIDLFHLGHMGPAKSQQGPTKREQGHNCGLQVVNTRISQKSEKSTNKYVFLSENSVSFLSRFWDTSGTLFSGPL